MFGMTRLRNSTDPEHSDHPEQSDQGLYYFPFKLHLHHRRYHIMAECVSLSFRVCILKLVSVRKFTNFT